MSTYGYEDVVCGLCGHSFEVTILTSIYFRGLCHLDGRAQDIGLEELDLLVHECPACGYASSDIKRDGIQFKKFIKTVEYQTCEGHYFREPLASTYYKSGMLEERAGLKKEAYDSFISAAWACDDVGDMVGAIVCRKKAIQLFPDLDIEEDPGLPVVQIDLLRRIGEFDAAYKLARNRKPKDFSLRCLISFQKALCKKRKRGCYYVTDCFSIWKRIKLWLK